jgi:large subunit ribosomal protein L31
VKANIHPKWFNDTKVTCMSCGTTWTTGATVPTITTEICSNCHPFYTGEQRIVDTEGRVDKFIKRLQQRDQIITEVAASKVSLTPMDLPLAELGLSKRYLTILEENGVKVVQDVLNKLQETGDQALLDINGIGRQVVIDIKKGLRTRGYKLPNDTEEVAE